MYAFPGQLPTCCVRIILNFTDMPELWAWRLATAAHVLGEEVLRTQVLASALQKSLRMAGKIASGSSAAQQVQEICPDDEPLMAVETGSG